MIAGIITAFCTIVAQAQIRSGSVYRLRNQCSGKVLDVSGVSQSNGALVHQWTDWNATNQQWKVEATSGSFYKLTAQHSGKALDVNNNGTSDGTSTLQWDYHGGNNQQWRLVSTGGGYYKLQPRHATSKALDVSGASTADGARVQIWTDNGTCAQRWQLELVSGGPPPANGNFQIANGRIYDPQGNLFVPRGANAWPDSGSSADFYKNAWNLNIVRLNHVRLRFEAWYNKDTLFYTIDEMTRRGIVAMIEWHEIGQIGDEPVGWNHNGSYDFGSSQGHIDAIKNFHMEFASRYVNNPYVWFNIINEPGGVPSANDMVRWENVSRQVIEGIRSTGNQNVIIVDGMTWGQDAGNSGCSNVTENDSAILARGRNLASLGNVAFNIHVYNTWNCNPEARLNQFFNDSEARGLTTFIGEFNDSSFEASQAAVNLARNRNIGRLVWHINAGDTHLTTGGSGSGHEINSWTNPTNLTPLGALVWDDLHR